MKVVGGTVGGAMLNFFWKFNLERGIGNPPTDNDSDDSFFLPRTFTPSSVSEGLAFSNLYDALSSDSGVMKIHSLV